MKKNSKYQLRDLVKTLKYIFKRHSENGKEENILPNNSSWKSMFDSLNFFTTDYMNQRNQPDLEEREDLFSRNIDCDK